MEQDLWFPEDYNLPSSGSDFMKLEKGENLFRVLSKPVMGWEYWTEDNKPVRSVQPFTEIADNAKKDKEGKVQKPKHIWIMAVWDYTKKGVKILTVTQKKVQEAILNLANDADWGSPMKYDIKVVREGDGLETKYALSPKPQKELAPEIVAAYEEVKESTEKTINTMF